MPRPDERHLLAPKPGIQVVPALVLPDGTEIRSTDPETATISGHEAMQLQWIVTQYREALKRMAWEDYRVALAVDAFTHTRMWDALEAMREGRDHITVFAGPDARIRLPLITPERAAKNRRRAARPQLQRFTPQTAQANRRGARRRGRGKIKGKKPGGEK